MVVVGFLVGYWVIIYWEEFIGFVERFFDVDVLCECFVIDCDCIICFGVRVVFDLIYYFIGDIYG